MDLEQRIAAALVDETVTATALTELFAETDDALTAAAARCEDERLKALDLTSEPRAAHEAVVAAELTRDRLRAALPRLRSKYQQTLAAEQYAAWLPRYEAAEAEQAALAQELAELYEPFVAQIPNLLLRIEQHINTVRNVNMAKPKVGHGDGRHLSDQIAGAHILRDLKLPAWDPRAGMAWPPQRPINFAAMIPVATDPRQCTGDWWKVQQERAQAAREQAQRDQQQHEAEALADYRGPRWWEGERPGPERAA